MSAPPSQPDGDPAQVTAAPAAAPTEDDGPAQDSTSGRGSAAPSRKRWGPALATGALAIALGFGLTVQIRSTGAEEDQLVTREDDLVRILDDLNSQEEQLRQQIAERRQAVEKLGSGQLESGQALAQAQERAEAIAVLNGSAAASGPGLRVTIQDPDGAVTAGILLDAIQELRGAGAEAIQVDDVRIVVSSYVGGDPGELVIDGQPITAPYDIHVIGPSDDLDVALNVSGGVIADVARFGGVTHVVRSDDVVVDATRKATG
jgi:uncharacterized protein YlxW (UPF0749 family)